MNHAPRGGIGVGSPPRSAGRDCCMLPLPLHAAAAAAAAAVRCRWFPPLSPEVSPRPQVVKLPEAQADVAVVAAEEAVEIGLLDHLRRQFIDELGE